MPTFEKVKLGSVVDVIPGYAFKSVDFSSDGKPVLKIKNIQSDFTISLEDADKINDSVLSERNLKKYKIGFNEIVVAMTGATIGKVGRFRSDGDVYLNQRVALFRPKNIDVNFLWAILRSEKYQNILKSLGGGAAQANMSSFQIEDVMLYLPDIKTQTTIASILSTYDDLIENNEKRIKILEEMAQRLYTEWFIKFKFPGYEKVKMVDANGVGMIPAGWVVEKLGDKINVLKGKNITQNTVSIGNVPVVAGGLEPAYYHNKANTKAPVITVSASGVNAGFINLYYEDIWASDCSYISGTATPFVYFYYLFLKNNESEIDRLQRGSAQPHVYPKDIMRLKITSAPEPLIAIFEYKVKVIFSLIGGFEKQNKNLSQTRDLLIPQLVTGKKELK